MTRLRRTYGMFCVAMLTLVGIGARSAPVIAQPADLTGVYLCEGVNPDGTTYRGGVSIAAEGETWTLRWVFDQGEGVGVGLLSGTILSVIFQTSNGIGVAAYAVDRTVSPMRLIGPWMTPGGPTDRLGSETLTKSTATDPKQLLEPPRVVAIPAE